MLNIDAVCFVVNIQIVQQQIIRNSISLQAGHDHTKGMSFLMHFV